jgi:DNA-binding NarL/FixJ family response regulator
LRLAELGVEVLAEADDGADGLGISIAEQPDLVLVEDRLPSLPALELVAAVREYAGHALVGAQVEHEADVAPLVEAGVNAVFSRRIPPAVMAEELHALLLAPPNQPLLVS